MQTQRRIKINGSSLYFIAEHDGEVYIIVYLSPRNFSLNRPFFGIGQHPVQRPLLRQKTLCFCSYVKSGSRSGCDNGIRYYSTIDANSRANVHSFLCRALDLCDGCPEE